MAPLREDELHGDPIVVYSIGRGAWEGRSA